MNLVGGIDGGQSSTVATIVDSAGAVRGRGAAGPSDHVGQPADSRRAALACESALAAALRGAGLPAETALDAVVIGLSGYEGAWHGAEPVLPSVRVRVVHDAPIALAGAIGTRPAGVVIAGTGSAAYGETAARSAARAGGFGYLFGDGGSAFAIARSALVAAIVASDRGIATDLGTAALAFFDVSDFRTFVRSAALHEIGRPQIAGFARVVLDAARLGDASARAIVVEAAAALADLAETVAQQLTSGGEGVIPFALVGGIGEAPAVSAAVAACLAERHVRITIVEPAYEPAVGAALLAFDEAELPRPAILTVPA